MDRNISANNNYIEIMGVLQYMAVHSCMNTWLVLERVLHGICGNVILGPGLVFEIYRGFPLQRQPLDLFYTRRMRILFFNQAKEKSSTNLQGQFFVLLRPLENFPNQKPSMRHTILLLFVLLKGQFRQIFLFGFIT